MKNQPIGIDDFKDLIDYNYFYVDKTKFIEEVCQNFKKSLLFTRPRRFGKSLNMSMLKYFFDIENKDENRKLFNGLYIENSKCMNEQGKYPVIFVSFKEIKEESWEICVEKIGVLISTLFEKYLYLFDTLDDINKQIFNNYRSQKSNIANLQNSLKFLSDILSYYHKQKVIILIDEYDAPLIYAYQKGYYEKILNFFQVMYGSVLKSNPNTQLGVMTGIIRVAQAGIFSDLNNLSVFTILKDSYDEYFGFTENEVKKALIEYNLVDNFDDVKYWYDGYKFGNAEIYNPWSILKYLESKKFEAYWINVSENSLITTLLKNTSDNTFDSLCKLLEDKKVVGIFSENVNLGKHLTENELWEFLLFAGYVTTDKRLSDDTYDFVIPNYEVKKIFKKSFLEIVFTKDETAINILRTALFNKDIPKIKESIEKLLLYALSFWELRKDSKESVYQLLLSGFVYGLDGIYIIHINRETGDGRADIILEPIVSETGYIFELKIKGNKENPLNQINEKRYDAELKRKGVKDIVKLGMIFDGKRVEFVE